MPDLPGLKIIQRLRRTRRALALALAGAVAACGGGIPLLDEPIVLSCPDYLILEDAATLTKFQDGPGRDITDIEVVAKIGNVRMTCLSEIDEDTNSGYMDISVAPMIAAEMGAANRDAAARLPYFVVVTDPDKNILYREELSMDVSFAGNRTRLFAVAPETIIEIPITPNVRSRYYRFYVGFDLSEEQVEHNRKQIRDRLR